MNRTTRTLLFWMFMIFLAVLLWRMASTSGQSTRTWELTYSEFLGQLTKDNVRNVTIYVSSNSAEVEGALKDSSSEFRVTIARETIPDLTRLLTEKKVVIKFREVPRTDVVSILLNLTPILLFILFIGLWIFMIRQMQKNKGPRPPGAGIG